MTEESERQRIAAATAGSLTSYELLLIVKGHTREEALAIAAEHRRIDSKADKLLNVPIAKWPTFNIAWDLSPASFGWALDGRSPTLPEGVSLTARTAGLAELDAVLNSYSKRTLDETWTIGDPNKLARVLVHCIEGRQLTPPWITIIDETIGIVGGNHRLAVCRAKALKEIPVLLKESEYEQICRLLPLRPV